MLFSIIVPMYNVEKYAEQCIESLLGQTYTNFELILIDDGSKDSTGKIIDDYAQKDSRIIVIHKQNGGVNSSRKVALANCSGDYIVPIDADDWVDETYLEKFYQVISEYKNVDIVCCENVEVTDTGTTKYFPKYKRYGFFDKKRLEKEIYNELLKFSPTIWGKVFKKEIYKKCQLKIDDSITMGEDATITYPAVFHSSELYIMNDCLYFYRFNPQSLTKNKKKESSTEGLLARISLLESEFTKSVFNLNQQLSIWVCHVVFNVVLSYFRTNRYNIAKNKAKKLLNNELIRKHINQTLKIYDKREYIAKISLKNKLFFLIKLYSLLS